jgi:asparaginyl-tRNA synthetase
MAWATHLFFQQRGFLYIQTPILTASDCEGGGDLFHVTTLAAGRLSGEVFFQRQAFLTVSGQLEAETIASALSDVYTFGPTFRAENSNTSRHLAEFWMIEPEMAFQDLHGMIDVAESYVKACIHHAFTHCEEDLAFFDQLIEPGLIRRLRLVLETPCAKVTYTEAIEILLSSKQAFTFPISWGIDLQSEHERFLAESYFQKPVVITDYPAPIKAFYMRANDDDKTVAAMDFLVPKVGELIGGSQREERLFFLEQKMKALHLPLETYDWYLDLRRFGTVPHAGFGVGFERLLLFITGLDNIRDVIPYPRYPGHIAP